MEKFRWLEGRQLAWINGTLDHAKYKKYCFLHVQIGRLGFDGYILKYPEKMEMLGHDDPIPGANHFRINVKLKGKCTFICNKTILSIGEFLHFFRPDKHLHQLVTKTPVVKISMRFAYFK